MKVIGMFFLFLLTACLQEGVKKPEDPLWERESCARCRMVLSEKRFAVQRILKSNEVLFYDDINCALQHDHNEEGTLYVRPYDGEEWLLANEVRYQSGLATPMSSGFGAVLEGGDTSFEDVVKKFRK